jgi:hypothetical protein
MRGHDLENFEEVVGAHWFTEAKKNPKKAN